MSHIVSLVGKSSVLRATYFPPLDLSECEWSVGLVGFQAYNSIPNITSRNCLLHYGDGKILTIPVGSYDISDINNYVQKYIPGVTITPNSATLQIEIKTKTVNLDFTQPESIGSVLGFTRIIAADPEQVYVSDKTVEIFDVTTIRIECNVVTHSYLNDNLSHTIHEFFPTVAAGYKIVEVPRTILYLPVTVQSLDFLEVRVVDQLGRLVDFRGEEIAVRLHFRKKNEGGL